MSSRAKRLPSTTDLRGQRSFVAPIAWRLVGKSIFGRGYPCVSVNASPPQASSESVTSSRVELM